MRTRSAVVAILALLVALLPAGARATSPSISSFSPGFGGVNTVVTILGSAFTGATAVRFNATPSASFTVVNDGRVTAYVPSGATTGPISVVTPGGTGTSSSSFTVTVSIFQSTYYGPPGTADTIGGVLFGSNEQVDIYFDTTDMALAATDYTGAFSGALITVPTSAVPGVHTVTATGRHSGLSAQKTFAVRTDWPSLHFTAANRGYNGFENVINPSNIASVDIDWTRSSSLQAGTPAVYQGLVYWATPAALLALNPATGAVVWSTPEGVSSYTNPAAGAGRIYVVSSAVSAYSASTGSLLWTSTGSGFTSDPVFAGNVVYVGQGQVLTALNAATGAVLWSTGTLAGTVTYPPAIGGGYLYVGAGGTLYRLDMNGANPFSQSGLGSFTGPPIFASGYVLVAGTNVSEYTAYLGLNWSTNGLTPVGGMAAMGTAVYAAFTDGKVRQFSLRCASPCAEKWATVVDTSPTVGSISAANGLIYVQTVSTGDLVALDVYGNLVWSVGVPSRQGAPVIANGQIFVGTAPLMELDLAGSTPQAPARPDPKTLHPDMSLRVQS